jgi:hypothetical protein
MSEEEAVATTTISNNLTYAAKIIGSSAYTVASESANMITSVDWIGVAKTAANGACTFGRGARAIAAIYGPEPIAEAAASLDPESSRALFRDMIPADERRKMFEELKANAPHLYPAILEKIRGSAIHPISVRKVLLKGTMSLRQLLAAMRRRLNDNDRHHSLYLCTENGIPFCNLNQIISELWRYHSSHEDGFLYIYYREEAAFGC